MSEWREVSVVNRHARELADRHYSRQSIGAMQFLPPGKRLCLITDTAVWGVVENLDPGGKLRWRCTIFRNEGKVLSSSLIREATDRTFKHWNDEYGGIPSCNLTTEVDAAKTKMKANPGYCFMMAGWIFVGIRRKLHILYAPRTLWTSQKSEIEK